MESFLWESWIRLSDFNAELRKKNYRGKEFLDQHRRELSVAEVPPRNIRELGTPRRSVFRSHE